MQLEPKKIRVDGGTQPRAELSIPAMEEYADDMRNGVKFEPITAFFDGAEYWLADGFHRMGAHLRAFDEDTPIEAEIIQGTLSDAQWYSYGVNKAHGLRRKPEDKARAVRAALQHPRGVEKSNREIAEYVGVSHPFVGKIREALESSGNVSRCETRTVTRNKSTYKQNTTNINERRRKKPSRKNQGVRISRNAHTLKIGHSSPCPMIPLQFSPNNPQTAAATLWQHFSRSYLETLIQELSQRLLTEEGETA